MPTNSTFNPLLRLHVKLNRTAKGLRKWAKKLLPQSKIAMAVCREVILQLDKAQEHRMLTPAETEFRKFLKNRLLGLLAIDKARARQKSCITWLRKGDANTKYFQIMANIRKKKNYIHMLQAEGISVTSRQAKHKAIFDHYSNHLGTYQPRSCAINLQNLNWEQRQLEHLDEPFSEQEIRKAIFQAPKEKAPGPDGYIGLFFTTCWDIIKEDLIAAINHFYNMNQHELHLLNQAFVVLIPKKPDPTKVLNYRPISLIHSFAKIVS